MFSRFIDRYLPEDKSGYDYVDNRGFPYKRDFKGEGKYAVYENGSTEPWDNNKHGKPKPKLQELPTFKKLKIVKTEISRRIRDMTTKKLKEFMTAVTEISEGIGEMKQNKKKEFKDFVEQMHGFYTRDRTHFFQSAGAIIAVQIFMVFYFYFVIRLMREASITFDPEYKDAKTIMDFPLRELEFKIAQVRDPETRKELEKMKTKMAAEIFKQFEVPLRKKIAQKSRSFGASRKRKRRY